MGDGHGGVAHGPDACGRLGHPPSGNPVLSGGQQDAAGLAHIHRLAQPLARVAFVAGPRDVVGGVGEAGRDIGEHVDHTAVHVSEQAGSAHDDAESGRPIERTAETIPTQVAHHPRGGAVFDVRGGVGGRVHQADTAEPLYGAAIGGSADRQHGGVVDEDRGESASEGSAGVVGGPQQGDVVDGQHPVESAAVVLAVAVVVEAVVADLLGAGTHLGVGVVAVPVSVRQARGGGAGRLGRASSVAVAVEVFPHLDGVCCGIIDLAVAVVVEAVAQLGGAGMDGRSGIVAVALSRGEAVAVEVVVVGASRTGGQLARPARREDHRYQHPADADSQADYHGITRKAVLAPRLSTPVVEMAVATL